MKRIILLMLLLAVSPAFGVDDDSTPYMPYPETPQAQSAPAKKPAPKKKAAPKKKQPAKKPAPKKTPAKKAAPARSSSLQNGIALMQQERYEQAKPYLLKAIQENRNDPNAWYWYGVYHEKTGGFHQAQYFYSKAVTIDPAFEPLSRVVFYPEDPEKTPLWDPKRPARVYPVEVASTGGLTTVPAGRSSFPTAPNDPELPHVPVYTPPEPGSSPLDGDAWSPAVYVPPGPDEVQTEGEMSPVYLPPEPQSIVAQVPSRQVLEVPIYDYPEGYETEYYAPTSDGILRADKPLYSPPNPGEKAPAVPKQAKQTVKKQTETKTAPKASATRKASVPDSRIVRQTQKPKRTTATAKPAQSTTTRRRQTVSQDVRPRSTPQTQPARTPEPTRTPEPVTLPPEPETRQQERPQYYPPVGQQAPDPGTISENPNLPPVGQGNQY